MTEFANGVEYSGELVRFNASDPANSRELVNGKASFIDLVEGGLSMEEAVLSVLPMLLGSCIGAILWERVRECVCEREYGEGDEPLRRFVQECICGESNQHLQHHRHQGRWLCFILVPAKIYCRC